MHIYYRFIKVYILNKIYLNLNKYIYKKKLEIKKKDEKLLEKEYKKDYK